MRGHLPSFLFAALLTCHPPTATGAEDVIDLGKWAVAKRGATFTGVANGLVVSGGRGWAYARQPLMDFVATLEFRAVTPDAEGAVVVRAGVLKPNAWPAFGYRISIGEPTNIRANVGTVKGYRHSVRRVGVPGAPASLPVSEGHRWHLLMISCLGDVVSVSLDGEPLATVEGAEPLAGYIGVEHVRGEFEVRSIRVVPQETRVSCAEPDPPDALNGPSEMAAARLLQRVAPEYPWTAEAAGISGTVHLRTIIGTDGLPSSPCVLKSLSAELDAHAIAALRRWRFAPAMLADGTPVEFVLRVSMSFEPGRASR